jgi:hypothetical protein
LGDERKEERMSPVMRTAVAAIAIPLLVSLLSGAFMMHETKRDQFKQTSDSDSKPLNFRPTGYNAEDVQRYWLSLGPDGIVAESQLPESRPSIYPFAYGGSLLFGLFLASKKPRSPATAFVLIAPVATTMAADWAENLIQLGQFDRAIGGEPPQDEWIRAASAATSIKWLALLIAVSLLVTLVAALFRQRSVP